MINPFSTSEFPTSEPDFLVNDKHSGWRRDFNIDSATFSIKYVFRKVSTPAETFDVTGVYDSDYCWVFEVTPTTITESNKGDYQYEIVLVRTSDNAEKSLGFGYLTIYLDTDDRRTHAEIMVAKITSILENRADSDVMNYSIKSRSITKMTPNELIEWRNYYLDEIARTGGSAIAGGDKKRAKTNTVRVRFT
jgi:hypothetical protein